MHDTAATPRLKSLWQSEARIGILLTLAAVAGLLIANSPWQPAYEALWQTHVTLRFGEHGFSEPLRVWVNDGLMAMFFFVIGLEIKREIQVGHLSSVRHAVLPIAAAAGGMIAPALIFLLLNSGSAAARGWAVPVATDIAFAIGLLALLGPRVPPGLKVFLVSLATVDDLGAVLVIAAFYTSDISFLSLAVAAGIFALLIASNLGGIRSPLWYGALAIGGLWSAFFSSGIHPTIAGVLAAFTIPARPAMRDPTGPAKLEKVSEHLEESRKKGGPFMDKQQVEGLFEAARIVRHSVSPLQRLEVELYPLVYYFALPIFAFANSGVRLQASFLPGLIEPPALGIILGLVLGKQLGITLASWLVARIGLAVLPAGVTLKEVYLVSWMGGVGFTMSLFIAGLAFDGRMLELSKIAVFTASLAAAVVGLMLLRLNRWEHRDA